MLFFYIFFTQHNQHTTKLFTQLFTYNDIQCSRFERSVTSFAFLSNIQIRNQDLTLPSEISDPDLSPHHRKNSQPEPGPELGTQVHLLYRKGGVHLHKGLEIASTRASVLGSGFNPGFQAS
jgi:hypothetical protein